jgi:geranylgeranylglycerol-phosphate geranylgeranyltransferase
MGKIGAYLEIIRPINSLMLGLAIIIGALISGGTSVLDQSINLLLAFITGFSLTGASMAINDYFDQEIDEINEPGRPLPSGRMEPVGALILTGLLSVIGIGAAFLVSIKALGLSVLAWILMMCYSAWAKKTGFLGNIIVSVCIGLPFIYGGLLSGNLLTATNFSLIAFLSNTGREITKGIVDVEGDAQSGISTVAVSMGEDFAAKFSALFYLGSVFSSLIPVFKNLVSIWYIPFVLITDLGLIHSSYSLVQRTTRENARMVKNRVLYLMLVGLIGFALGGLLK